ncbi:WD40 repeat domain-containing protein [Streptomyces beihaiensis]|uniref:Ig-like domain repeat protein n=1 Tax=Streptomyces beihaiensis TaxID=2984495 RepID=A0ABT3TZE3_9ACTN|nr:Ig-like domain repeat protein [Streptomyces beihaiensis]MCX3062399.1 Ig-like domain repeat protein [Streptomyces beihaiensis]
MNIAHRPGRLAATALAVALAGTGLSVAVAPVASAAASDVVAKLPISSYSAMAVDSVHQRVYVADRHVGSTYYTGTVVVYSFAGDRVSTISTDHYVSGLALSPDSSTLYVGERTALQEFSTTTYQPVAAVAIGADYCGRDLVSSSGRVYMTSPVALSASGCDTARTELDDVADGAYARTGWNDYGLLKLAAGPGDRMLMGQPRNADATDPYLAVFDTSGSTLVRGAERRFAASDGTGALNLKDMAFSVDGGKVAVADASYGTRLLNTSDLSDASVGYPALPAGAVSSAVAYSGDGKYLARGAAATGSTPDLLLSPADPSDATPPLEFVFEGSLDGDRVAPRGLEWTADGSRLFAVTTNATGNQYWLHVIQPPAAQYATRFSESLTHSPSQAVAGEPLALHGTLAYDGPTPTEPLKVSATRTDANGTHDLGTATVASDGTFTVLDEPDLVGDATYTVSFLGDLTHLPAKDVATTLTVAKAPTSITLTAPAEASQATGVQITGTFTAQGKALAQPATLSVERTDKLGSGALTSVTVAADGTFTIKDLPRERKDVTYTVSWPGDDLHEGSSASATVYVTK